MTRRHMEAAAEQVKSILQGEWSMDAPSWAHLTTYVDGVSDTSSDKSLAYVRAVLTAEAYILLFTRYNPLFNRARFLSACGLASK